MRALASKRSDIEATPIAQATAVALPTPNTSQRRLATSRIQRWTCANCSCGV
jgi:hypothetical protein